MKIRKIRREILNALEEDMPNGDISSQIFSENEKGEFKLIAKEKGLLCGTKIFCETFHALDQEIEIEIKKDGVKLNSGNLVGLVKGRIKNILSAERTALNFLGRMSAISTATAKLVSILSSEKMTNIKLADTRKTTPNLRSLEKYSVRIGGGINHRFNLSDMIMLKDNHIASAGGVSKAIKKVKKIASFSHKIEVEAENEKMATEAAESGADIIMLDNMPLKKLKLVAKKIKNIDENILIELSGNVTAENISNYKNIPVDIISSGAITHSAGCLDFSLKVFTE